MLLKQLFPLFVPVLWTADGAGTGGGSDASGDGNGDNNNTSTGGGQTPGNASTDGANNGSGDDQTISVSEHQAELNRVAGKTRKEALATFAKSLGLEGIKDLETIVKAKQEADDKAKSELDKANEAKDEAERKAQAAEQQAANALMRASFDRAGTEEIEDLDLAWLAAKDMGLLDGEVEVKLETGQVSGMDKVVKQVLEKKPTLKKTSRGQAGGTDGSAGSSTAPSEPTDEEKAAYKRRFGIRN